MIGAIPWIAIAVLGLLLLFAVVYLSKKEKREPDYKTFFIGGLVFIGLYVISILSGMEDPPVLWFILGITFLATSLANKDKWGKPPRLLTEREIKIQKTIIIALAVLAIFGLVIFLLKSRGI